MAIAPLFDFVGIARSLRTHARRDVGRRICTVVCFITGTFCSSIVLLSVEIEVVRLLEIDRLGRRGRRSREREHHGASGAEQFCNRSVLHRSSQFVGPVHGKTSLCPDARCSSGTFHDNRGNPETSRVACMNWERAIRTVVHIESVAHSAASPPRNGARHQSLRPHLAASGRSKRSKALGGWRAPKIWS